MSQPKGTEAVISDEELITSVWREKLRIIYSDTPQGFALFYLGIHGKELPEHAWKWILGIYEARKKGKGIVIEAFRGSTKTTTVTITFTAYRIGLEPYRANLLVQVGDDIATDNAAQVADIIANSPRWKAIFPHVEPDRERGWGAGGYEVKVTNMPYEEWRKMNSGRKDPTLIGLGYKSREIIGKHPDGVLIVDDIHDENNTSSEKELSTVRKILTGTIFPTFTPDTWKIFIGTPWVENDCLSYVKSTGEFDHIRTPVLEYAEGTPVYAWEEKFNEQEVTKQRNLAGEIEFARMFLLDLQAAKGINLKAEWLHEYPVSELKPSYPVFFGIDYASTSDKMKDKDRDYFVLAIGRAIPGGGLVLVDGFRGRLSKGEALDTVIAYWALYPTLKRIGVESIGKGEEFYNDLLLTKDLAGRVPPLMAVKHGRRSKGERFEKWLAPRFQAGRIWIADAHTPFLNEFRNEWLSFPNGKHDDCLDGCYMMCIAGEGFLPSTAERTMGSTSKQRRENALFESFTSA